MSGPAARLAGSAGPAPSGRRASVSRRPAVAHHVLVGCPQVLAAQRRLEQQSLVPGLVVTCRARLTLASRYLGGSAAYLTGTLGPLSPRAGASLAHRTLRAGRLLVFGPSAPCAAATMASADPCPPVAAAYDATSPFGQDRRSPGVRRSTFAPSTRRIYARPVRVTSGFRYACPLAHLPDAPYAVRVPRAGALPTASFPLHLAMERLPFS